MADDTATIISTDAPAIVSQYAYIIAVIQFSFAVAFLQSVEDNSPFP